MNRNEVKRNSAKINTNTGSHQLFVQRTAYFMSTRPTAYLESNHRFRFPGA